MTELALASVGPSTSNPYDRRYTPGGSSSGSAAAVRDFQCHVSFGTQTGGSTIRPGSYNGIFAMKPTWESISREGLKTVSLILDTFGFYARSITDFQLLSRVFHLFDDIPLPLDTKPLVVCKVLYVKTQSWDIRGGSSELERCWTLSKDLLAKAGASVEEHDLPIEFDSMAGEGSRAQVITRSDARTNLLAEYTDPTHRPHLDPDAIKMSENQPRITCGQLLDAYDSIAALRPVMDKVACGYDAIVTPSTPASAPMGLGWTGDTRFNAMWTALHVPRVNIPGFASENGLPIGLTLVAPRYEDERLLSVARRVAEVWMDADGEKLKVIPVPEGTRFLQV